MNQFDNIKPGDVFEFYDAERIEYQNLGENNGFEYPPYRPRDQETIYLGREDIGGIEYGHFLAINNNNIQPITFYYKEPISNFLQTKEKGFHRNKQGSKIPQPLLEEIRFSIEQQKQNLETLEKGIPVELPNDVKNKVLSYFALGNKIKQHYGGGRIIKYRKSRGSRKSRRSRKSRKSKKHRKTWKNKKT